MIRIKHKIRSKIRIVLLLTLHLAPHLLPTHNHNHKFIIVFRDLPSTLEQCVARAPYSPCNISHEPQSVWKNLSRTPPPCWIGSRLASTLSWFAMAAQWRKRGRSPLLAARLGPFGLCRGEFTVPDDFDASLPTTMCSWEFEGQASSALDTHVFLSSPATWKRQRH